MNNQIKYIFSAIILLVAVQVASAQGRFGITYNTALPLGETADLVSKYSWRGMGIESRWEIATDVYLGFNSSWNTFYESKRGTFTEGTRTLTGSQYCYVNSLPLLFTGYKHFSGSGAFTPYIGLGVGTMYAEQERQMGLWVISEDNWHFAFAPEIGTTIYYGAESEVLFSIRYNYALESNDSPAVSYIGINLGFIL